MGLNRANERRKLLRLPSGPSSDDSLLAAVGVASGRLLTGLEGSRRKWPRRSNLGHIGLIPSLICHAGWLVLYSSQ